ncbi:6165_t:CDS:2 [Paraglomus brasilianum]|uniref:P-type Cu(+) transporter n=1 Tax=Paraglomus brasilianum TaxID=144538 RepID=A0A9N8ZVX9_9GLOM|nr:6165_t:CDS:2 [Paraglomus brasilianum]
MSPAKSDDDVIPIIVNVVPSPNEQYKASLVILGITCASCVSIIEKTIKSLPSVVADSVSVNLLTGDTRFVFTDSTLTSSVIRDTVESIGYDVESVTVTQHEFKHMSLASSVFSRASKPKGDDVDLSPVTTRLAITGMTCASCVKVVQDTLQKLPGVLTATVNLLLNEASIEHELQLAGPRDLIDAIESVGYEAKLIIAQTNRNLIQERARKQTQLLKKRFLLSLAAAIPTFVISMVIIMWLPDDHPIKMKFRTEIIPGLDVATVILFVIATPVQFYLGAPFYMKAYKSLRYAHVANMETLVAIGTSVSYFGSIATVMIAISEKSKNYGGEFFETSVFLITFIWLGKLMEVMAKGKTFESITKLMELQPEKATLVEVAENNEETEKEIDFELIQVNDILKVNAGAKFPCDGVITRGIATIDESMLTGEPIPVVKSLGDQVFSATLNLNSTTWIQATHVGTDTTLARIITLIQEAQASKKAPIEVLADKISQYFVPAVILIATIDFLIWLILGALNAFPKEWIPESQSYPVFALFFGISVLVIACPCAMGLASPTAIMVGTGVAAKFGILIKGGGEAIQMASRINTIVFDKTGTLTRGRPAVVNCRLFINRVRSDRRTLQQRKLILQIIGLVESASNHPLALAVCQMTTRKLQEETETDDVVLDAATEVPGKGLQATVSVTSLLSSTLIPCKSCVPAQTTKYNVCIGSYEWVKSLGFCYPPGLSEESTTEQIQKWREQGQSIVVVGATMMNEVSGSSANLIIAQFGIADTIRTDAAYTVNWLKDKGIDVWMITGDHPTAANTVAKQLNIDNVIAQVTPENKAEKVKWLQRRIRIVESPQTMGKKTTKELDNGGYAVDKTSNERPVVAMIGDGINDSPALAQADLGISIASGTDIAIESASVILARSTLKSLTTMIQLSQAIIKRIRINFVWAFLYNTIVIPIAAGVFFPLSKKSLPPELAGLLMVCSSVSVVLSSLLLRKFREK